MNERPAHGPLAPWHRVSVGSVLVRFRKRAGLTGTQLAALVGVSQAKISRWETGKARATLDEVDRIAMALSLTDDERHVLVKDDSDLDPLVDWRFDPADFAQRQQDLARVESAAGVLRTFSPLSVTGILQTSEYARGILAAVQALFSEDGAADADRVFQSVAARVGRQHVLAETGKQFHLIMPETVLRNRICPPAQMLAQIQRIKDVVKQHENVIIALLPQDEYWPPAGPYFAVHDNAYVLLDLPHSTVVLTGEDDIALYRRLFDTLVERATTNIDPILDRYIDMYYELARPRRG